MNDSVPLVSICSTTYNLENYITDAIESWLAQVTTFDYEIVICDDFSKDRTVEIIEQYTKRYPEKIKLLKSEKKLSMMPNFIRSLKAAKGKYIAICDGDDYWIDTNKLQMQIDFLEKNEDFVACLTNSYVINEQTKEKKIAKRQIWDVATTKELLYHDDFHKDNINLSPGHISTYVFRNHLIENFPEWFYDDDVVTDYPLYMLISKYGKTKFINAITSVYRQHQGSHSFNWYDYLKIEKSRIKMHTCINEYFNYQYNYMLKPIIAKHYINIFKYYKHKKSYYKMLLSLLKSIHNSPKVFFRYFFYHELYK